MLSTPLRSITLSCWARLTPGAGGNMGPSRTAPKYPSGTRWGLWAWVRAGAAPAVASETTSTHAAIQLFR